MYLALAVMTLYFWLVVFSYCRNMDHLQEFVHSADHVEGPPDYMGDFPPPWRPPAAVTAALHHPFPAHHLTDELEVKKVVHNNQGKLARKSSTASTCSGAPRGPRGSLVPPPQSPPVAKMETPVGSSSASSPNPRGQTNPFLDG